MSVTSACCQPPQPEIEKSAPPWRKTAASSPLAHQEEAAVFRAALLSILFVVSSFGSSLSFTLTDASPTVGSPFEVVVELTTDQIIAGYQFDLLFTPNLEVVTITQTGFFLTGGLGLAWTSIDNGNGIVMALNDVAVGGGGVTGIDSLMRIEFLPIAPGEVTVNLDNVLTIDDNFEIVLTTWESRMFSVEPAPPTGEVPEPGSLMLTGGAMLILTARRGIAKRLAAWRKNAQPKPQSDNGATHMGTATGEWMRTGVPTTPGTSLSTLGVGNGVGPRRPCECSSA
jgi:hypothetical protein